MRDELTPTVRSVASRDGSDRDGHNLSVDEITESTLVQQRAVAQQLGQHGQRLVGEILVDKGFLPA